MNLMMMIQNAAKRASIIQSFKRAGARMVLFADSIPGSKYPILAPRTLPNGIKNSDTIQRVSGDVVLTAADITYFAKQTNTCLVRILKPSLASGYNNVTTFWSVFGDYTEEVFFSSNNDNVEKIGKYACGQINTQFVLILPLDFANDLAEAKTKLTGTVLRYQLATPIDTLNSPPPTPWIDLTGNTNNATMQGLANTQDSGMAYVPLLCETGVPVEYENLVPDPLFNDITPWIVLNGSKSASGGILTITGTGASTLLRAVRDLGVKPPNGSRLLQRIKFRLNQSGAISCNALLRDGDDGAILGVTSVNNPIAGQWYSLELAQIVNCGTLAENVHLFISASYPDNATQLNKTVDIEKPQVVNISTPQITALESQMANPLTALECDRILPFVPTIGVSKIGLRPMMMFDGINDHGVLANNPSVDIVGTGDFAIAVGFLTANTIPNGMQILSKNLDSTANTQFHVRLYSDGSCEVCLNGIQILVVPTANIVANTMYDLRVYRTNGRLIAKLQAVEKYNQVNSIALASQPHLRLGARSNSSDGLTNGAFFKGGMAWAIIATSAEVANIDKALDRKARDYRLMGVIR